MSQLIAALAAEEAGKTGALAQLRAAQSRAAQLEVCSSALSATKIQGMSRLACTVPNISAIEEACKGF